MKVIFCLVFFTSIPLGFPTNLGRLIKRLDIRLSQLVRDRYAGSQTYLTTIQQMNTALAELAERVANPRSNSGILRLGQAVISSGTPHFVKYTVTERELRRRYSWSDADLHSYYQLINQTITQRRVLDNICRKVSLESKVYHYYYNNRQQQAFSRNTSTGKTHFQQVNRLSAHHLNPL